MRAVLVTGPASEPLTLTEAKAWLRVDGAGEDDLITSLIASARGLIEEQTGRALITQNWKLVMDAWPQGSVDALGWWDGVKEGSLAQLTAEFIEMPRPPLQSITSIKTYDADDVATLWASTNYKVDTVSTPGRVSPKAGTAWPVPTRSLNGIEVEFVAGYGDASGDVPEGLKAAVRQLLAHLYEHRGDETGDFPMSVSKLIRQYKVQRL